MPRGIVIPADTGAPLRVRAFDSVEDYQAAVDGYIEPVDVDELGATIYVNEEGLLRQLPFNPRATFFWWIWHPAAKNSAMLVGDAVLIGMPDDNGETTDVPSTLELVLLHDSKFKVEVKTVGDPKWYSNDLVLEDYFDAAVWGMTLLERWTAAEKVRIAPIPPIGTEPRKEVEPGHTP